MILHPDGRIEGTPDELQRFDELRKATPVTLPIPVIEPIPQTWRPWQPGTAPGLPRMPWESPWIVTCESGGSVTYKPNPNVIHMN